MFKKTKTSTLPSSTLINFHTETMKQLLNLGIFPATDVKLVSDGWHNATWEDFEKQSLLVEYDYGYGSIQQINPHLIIVGENWWFERGRDEGNFEWWIYHKTPINTIPDLPFSSTLQIMNPQLNT